MRIRSTHTQSTNLLKNTLPIILLISALTTTFSTSLATPKTTELLTPADATSIVRDYTSADASRQMPEWKKLIIRPDHNYRQAVLKSLSHTYEKFQNRDEKLNSKLNSILTRALEPYEKQYTLIVLNHPGPQIMHESYETLIITTGLLERVPSDDALDMFLYHEMAHDLFAEETLELKRNLSDLATQTKLGTQEAQQTIKKLMLIELKCDAAATLFELAAGRNPTQYIKVIENIYKEFPKETSGHTFLGFNIHPAPSLRRLVVEEITNTRTINVKPQLSNELKAIKSILGLERMATPPNAASL